ncbi:MAG: hypothetical protein UIT84_04410, partial [Lachnospiraceae bacterium]
SNYFRHVRLRENTDCELKQRKGENRQPGKTENSSENTVNFTKIQNSIRKNSQQKLSQKVHKKLALTS